MSDKVSWSSTWNFAVCPICPNVRATEICRDIVLMDPLSSRHDSHGAPVAAKAGMPQGNLYPYYTFLNRGSLQSKVAILGRKQWGFRCHLIISCFQRSLITTFRVICSVRIQNIYTNYPSGLRNFVNINSLSSDFTRLAVTLLGTKL